MSLEMAHERVCYVHCKFCSIILAVSVPCSSLFTIVTVRCGHCANLLSVNMGALLQSPHVQEFQQQPQKQLMAEAAANKEDGSSSSSMSHRSFGPLNAAKDHQVHPKSSVPVVRPPEKRQRVPSAYNRFIKEEIQRIKASNPEISHREAFSAAAKNWAHLPHIHNFGLKNKQPVLMNQQAAAVAREGTATPKDSHGLFY